MKSNLMKYAYAAVALAAWFAVVTQLYLNISSGTFGLSKTLIIFFSYFTILTNILVATCCTALCFNGIENGKFFTKQKTLAAAAMYITVVAVIYNTVLRAIWSPTGMQRIVDEMLHVIVPFFFVFFWVIFIPKNKLAYKNAFAWMLFPVLYTFFIVVRGFISGYYPYPFADIDKLGIRKVLINAGIVAAVFLVLSLMVIALGKFLQKKIP